MTKTYKKQASKQAPKNKMVDYSKWKKIEISDDEDDTHPNIDTASLFRWRHKARIEREEKHRQSYDELLERKSKLRSKLNDDKSSLIDEGQLKTIDDELNEIERKLADLNKHEKLQPWNVDTISKDSWSGTILNRKCIKGSKSKHGQTIGGYDDNDDDDGDGDELTTSYSEHIKQYESKIKEFAFHSNFDFCRRFLLNNPNIVNRFTLDYLSIWCIELRIEGKNSLFEHVSRQAVMIQLILDLAKTAGGGIDPRSCLSIFFNRSAKSMDKFEKLFTDELDEFRQRIEMAADSRMQHALEMQTPDQLIGPGGLNAQEVFDSLPEELQQCFQTRSRQHMQETLAKMEPEQAEYHLKRCIDSGLWSTEPTDFDEDEQMLAEVIAHQQQQQLKDNMFKQLDDEEQSEESNDS